MVAQGGTLMKRSISTKLFGIVVLSMLMIFAVSTNASAQGRGRNRDRNWDKKCSKFVNCHDARNGRWDGRGPNRRFSNVSIYRRNRRERNWNRWERRRRHRDNAFARNRYLRRRG